MSDKKNISFFNLFGVKCSHKAEVSRVMVRVEKGGWRLERVGLKCRCIVSVEMMSFWALTVLSGGCGFTKKKEKKRFFYSTFCTWLLNHVGWHILAWQLHSFTHLPTLSFNYYCFPLKLDSLTFEKKKNVHDPYLCIWFSTGCVHIYVGLGTALVRCFV